MVSIKWKITDDITSVRVEEFNEEWPGIDGFFEILINGKQIGYCPDRELLAGEECYEDILYWLSQLLNSIIEIEKYNTKYELMLLDFNLLKIIIERKDQNILLKLVNILYDEIEWTEIVSRKEWYSEIISSADKFIENIREINPDLLNAKMIKELTRIELSDLKKFI